MQPSITWLWYKLLAIVIIALYLVYRYFKREREDKQRRQTMALLNERLRDYANLSRDGTMSGTNRNIISRLFKSTEMELHKLRAERLDHKSRKWWQRL